MDYRTLAQLSNPGQSPLTSGVVDPIGYNRWQNLANMQQMALQRSIPLADMDLTAQTQKNKEYMAGAEGRENLIKYGNMQAADKIAGFDEEKVRERLQNAVKDAKTRKELSDFTADLEDQGPSFVQSKDDPETQDTILSAVKGRVIRSPDGKTYTMGTDKQRDRVLLTMAGLSRINDPKYTSKLEQEKVKAASKKELETMRQFGANSREELRAKAIERRAALLAQAQNRPLKPEEIALLTLHDPNTVEGASAILQHKLNEKAAVVTTRTNAQAAATNNLLQGNTNVPSAQPPTVAPATRQQPKYSVTDASGKTTNANPSKEKEPAIGAKWDTEENGKRVTRTIVNIGRDPKTNKILKIKLDNGVLVDYK